MTKATNAAVTKANSNKGGAKAETANKEVISAANTPATVIENKEVIKPATKADVGRAIMTECYADMSKVPARKDIIGRLVAEAKLTPSGAATYLQNFKSKHGLTQKALAEKAAGGATA